MVLVRLAALQTGVPPTKDHRTPFSIILTAKDKQCYFPQGIYTVEWDELGTFELFLVPIGPTAEGMNYQAVFG